MGALQHLHLSSIVLPLHYWDIVPACSPQPPPACLPACLPPVPPVCRCVRQQPRRGPAGFRPRACSGWAPLPPALPALPVPCLMRTCLHACARPTPLPAPHAPAALNKPDPGAPVRPAACSLGLFPPCSSTSKPSSPACPRRVGPHHLHACLLPAQRSAQHAWLQLGQLCVRLSSGCRSSLGGCS